jgi:HlyD family secretion protein
MNIIALLDRIRNMGRKGIRNLLIIVILAAAVIYSGFWAFNEYVNRDKITASGTIEAVETTVSTKVPGRIVSFSVDEGDTVKSGSVIASLESSELYAGFKQTVAIEKSAQIKYDNAMRNYIRSKSLKKRNMVSDQEFDSVTSIYEAAQAELSRSSASRAVAEIAYNDASIKAPISGTILTKAAEIGDLLSPYSTVVTMADLSTLEIMLYVSETRYGRIKLGDSVSIFVDSYPGTEFTGKVTYISDKAEFTPKNIQTKEERVTQVFGIKIEIPNPKMELKPGMPADAVIYLSK